MKPDPVPHDASPIPGSDAGDAAKLPPVELTPEQQAALADEAKQAEYRRQFEIQQRRRSCPECGDP